MRFANKSVLSAALLAVALALPSSLFAQGFERPASFAANKIRGLKPIGESYAVRSPVRSDGFLRIYTLTTPYGDAAVHGDQMLRMRLNELAALAELEKVSGSETFSTALVEAGLSPIKYTGRFIANPVQTVGDTLAGIGNLFGSIGSGIANAGRTSDDPMAGLLGISTQRRQLAVKLGVDPYTDYEPLSIKLRQLSEAAAMGGLAVSGALMAIPGAAGIVVSNLSTANKLGDIKIDDLAREYTAAQILDLNRQRLAAMGIEQNLAEMLLANRNYTPVDMAALVAALESMGGVQDRAIFVARAASVDTRSIAYFMRRQAEMLAGHQARTGTLTRFVSLGGYPFNVTREGRVVGLMPVDALSWTQGTADAFTRSTSDLKRVVPQGSAELRITGQATGMAKQRLKAFGWTVVENVRI